MSGNVVRSKAHALMFVLATVAHAGALHASQMESRVESSTTRIEPAAFPNPLPLSWCLERAADRNPALLVAGAEMDAAREMARVAGRLDDPRFSYQASNIPIGDFDFKSTPLSGHQIGLHQRIPMPGLLRAQNASAQHSSRAMDFALDDRRRVIAAAVERAWSKLGFAQRALEITDRNIETLGQLTEITESRYSVGTGLQQDVLRAHVELTTRYHERLEREAALEVATAHLASLLDLPVTTQFPQTTALDELASLPDLESLDARTQRHNPQLAALRERVDAAEKQARAAKLEGLPDLDLGLGYRVRQNVARDPVEGDDFLSAGVTIRLPVDRPRWRANQAAHDARTRGARARLRNQEVALRERLRIIHAELVRADREVELLRNGLVPQARQSLASSRAAYEVGRIEIRGLLDSHVSLLTAQLREVQAAGDRRVAFGLLESVVGERLR